MSKAAGQVTGLLSPLVERLRLSRIARHVPPGSRVLDVGCGRGRLLDFITAPAGYAGVDIIEQVITDNRRAGPGRLFLLLDIEEGRLPDGCGPFDVIAIGAALEHFRKPARTLARLGESLRPGGRIVLTTPAPAGGGIIEFCSGIGLLSREAAEEHQDLYSRADIERLAREAGLRVALFERFLFGLNQLAVMARA
ncbi:MAG: class I SAM-dependent methyltransferase [Nitrospirae bacterium]|nr:class I SAM-dependent methyltransferase [Nitrospirota bacterium]